GYRIPLEDRPFRALVILLQNANSVVTREELQAQLWPSDVFIDFNQGLNAATGKIRRALNDSAEKPRFIETVGRRGYRFIGEVSSEPAEPSTAIQDLVPIPIQTERRAPVLQSRQLRGAAAIVALLVLIGLSYVIQSKGKLWSTNGQPIKSLAVLPLENL